MVMFDNLIRWLLVPRVWLLLVVGLVVFGGAFGSLRPVFYQWMLVTAMAQSGSLTEVIPGWGLVLGEEKVYYAQHAGKVIWLVNDGQRVRANAVIGEIVDESQLALAELKRLDIQSRQDAVGNVSLQQEIAYLAGAVAAAEQALREAVLQGDHVRIEAMEKSLKVLQSRLQAARRGMTSETESYFEFDPSDYSRLVRAPRAGIVRFSGDGYVGLDVDTVRGLSRKAIEAKRSSGWQVADGELVGVGTPLFRLDLGHELWCYLILNRVDIPLDVKSGDELSLRIPGMGDSPFAAVVENVDVDTEKATLVIRLSGYVKELIDWRSGPVELVKNVYTGVIVPASSLIERNGAVGVYLESGSENVFSLVREIGRVGDRVAVSGIPIGARVVVNPQFVLDKASMRPN